jgi:hypothetical protein
MDGRWLLEKKKNEPVTRLGWEGSFLATFGAFGIIKSNKKNSNNLEHLCSGQEDALQYNGPSLPPQEMD